MELEIFGYGLVLFAALVLAISNKISRVAFIVLLFALSVNYVVVIRLAEFNGDINNYARAFQYSSFSLYYSKEFLYWYGSRLIFFITNSEVMTFLFIDLFVLCFFFAALRMFRVPKYAFFLILIIFPNFFGFQNIYRQLIASSLLLLGIAYAYAGKRGSFAAGILALCVHNPSAFTLSISNRFVRRSRLFGLLVGIFFGFCLSILARLESNSSSGGNFSIILSSVVIILIVLLTCLNTRGSKQSEFIGYFWGMGAISIFSPILLSPSIAERLSFYMIVLLFPFVVISVEKRFRPIAPVRVFIVFAFSMPTFISSGREFLL